MAHPVFKTGVAEQPSAWIVRFHRGNEESAEGVLRVVVDLDGTGHLFGGRAGSRMNDGRLVFVERYTAGNG